MSTYLTGHPATPVGLVGSVRFFVPRGKSQTAQLWGLLYFLLRVVCVPPHHQGSFLAVSVPLHLDQLPFPSLIFPFRVSSHLLWAGEQDDQSISDLRSQIREHGVWMKACWVLLGVPCPKFVSPILAIWRHFIFGLSFSLYSAKWRLLCDAVTYNKDE